MGLRDALAHAWTAFKGDSGMNYRTEYVNYGASFNSQPYRTRSNINNDKTIISAIYSQIAIDAASVSLKHIRRDSSNRFQEEIKSGLHYRLTEDANLDQAGSAFRLDMVNTLLEQGHIAIVAVETSSDPDESGSYTINELRVGQVVTWYPSHVRVSVYNQKTAQREEVTLPKSTVAIVENPHYKVMNEHNSTLQRLIRKLNLLDTVDEASSSGKLDLIIQLPYVIKSDARRDQAEKRARDIEAQLKGSKYGIAYTDGTERITQLNRPAENQMLKQVDYLTEMLYGQLGMSKAIIDGTANEATMLNYYNRTIEPILKAISEEISRTFLTKTARTQGQIVVYQNDPFKLVPVGKMADIADKMIRNTILTPNEFRAILGYPPVKGNNADQLTNPNIPNADGSAPAAGTSFTLDSVTEDMTEDQYLDLLDDVGAQIDSILQFGERFD